MRALGLATPPGVKPATVAHLYAFASFAWSPLGFLLPGQAPGGQPHTHRGGGDYGGGGGGSAVLAAAGLAVGIGVLAVANQLMWNTGIMRVPAGLGSMMRNTDIVASYGWQVGLLGQPVTALSGVGAALVVGSTVAQAARKLRAQRSESRRRHAEDAGRLPDLELLEVRSPMAGSLEMETTPTAAVSEICGS